MVWKTLALLLSVLAAGCASDRYAGEALTENQIFEVAIQYVCQSEPCEPGTLKASLDIDNTWSTGNRREIAEEWPDVAQNMSELLNDHIYQVVLVSDETSPEGCIHVVYVGTNKGRVLVHYGYCPASREDFQFQLKFRRLMAGWNAHLERVMFSSRDVDYTDCDAYREIVKLGQPVLPLIIEEMRRDTNPWLFRVVEDVAGVAPPDLKKTGWDLATIKEFYIQWWKTQQTDAQEELPAAQRFLSHLRTESSNRNGHAWD